MNDTQKIRGVVARYFDVPENQVTESFVFSAHRLQSSAGRATLHAAIKRMAGADLQSAWKAKTFGELINGVPAETATAAPLASRVESAQPVPPPPSEGASIGIDIENIEDHPWGGDAISEPFFQENFTAAERAYCSRQSRPKLSLCGLWCAKEAAIKSGGPFAGLKPGQIQITHDERGRPALRTMDSPVANCSLSISHSERNVVAVCVLLPQVRVMTATVDSSAKSQPHCLTWVGFLVGAIGLALAVWSLMR